MNDLNRNFEYNEKSEGLVGGYNQQESGKKVKNWNELPARKKAADPAKAGAALFATLQLRVCWNKESEEFL